MNKVYIIIEEVFFDDDSASQICGVYFSQEKAKEECEYLNKSNSKRGVFEYSYGWVEWGVGIEEQQINYIN
jgi:hypothetical protein